MYDVAMDVPVMNPWHGVFQSYPSDALDSYYRGSTLVLNAYATRPTPSRDETTEDDHDHNAMCGADMLSAMLWAVGVDAPAVVLEQKMRAAFGEAGVAGGTNAYQLKWASTQYGVNSTIYTNQPSTTVAFLGIGRPVGICVWCTSYAVPCTPATSIKDREPNGFGHWLAGCATIQGSDVPLQEIAQ